MEKRKSSLGKSLLKILFLVPSLFSLIGNITTLIEIEARVAGKSLIKIILLLMLLGMLLMSCWGCVQALLFLYLISLKLSAVLSLFIVLALNMLMILCVTFAISRNKKSMFFPETYRQLVLKKRKLTN